MAETLGIMFGILAVLDALLLWLFCKYPLTGVVLLEFDFDSKCYALGGRRWSEPLIVS